jgi:hypothetical protein
MIKQTSQIDWRNPRLNLAAFAGTTGNSYPELTSKACRKPILFADALEAPEKLVDGVQV